MAIIRNVRFVYTYDAALAAIPERIALPSDADWKNLERLWE